jgi:hypothetical protein
METVEFRPSRTLGKKQPRPKPGLFIHFVDDTIQLVPGGSSRYGFENAFKVATKSEGVFPVPVVLPSKTLGS